LEALGTSIGYLAVEQQGQPFGVREIARGILRYELEEGLGHTIELQGFELIKARMCEHGLRSPQWK
jgi:hypothetical protein